MHFRVTQTNPKQKKILADVSLWSLLATNLIAIVLAYFESWDVSAVIFIYWSQIVAIGILWFIKISCLINFSTKNMGDDPLESTRETARFFAFVFLFHYGLFLAIFPGSMWDKMRPTSFLVFFGSLIFAVQHIFSFFYNRKWQTPGRPHLVTMMIFPYLRILPMCFPALVAVLTVTGVDSRSSLVYFMLLKTAADLIMHTVERKGFVALEET